MQAFELELVKTCKLFYHNIDDFCFISIGWEYFRGDYHSHYTNAIRVFWWSLLWAIIGWATSFALIGFGILAIAWLWAVYRLVLGLAKILDDEAYSL